MDPQQRDNLQALFLHVLIGEEAGRRLELGGDEILAHRDWLRV
jgi:hypothetical protein